MQGFYWRKLWWSSLCASLETSEMYALCLNSNGFLLDWYKNTAETKVESMHSSYPSC